MDFERVDMREMTAEELIKAGEMAEIVFKLNHTLPNSDEYNQLIKELFGDNIGENSTVMAPIQELLLTISRLEAMFSLIPIAFSWHVAE